MKKLNQIAASVVSSPVVWGLMATMAFYAGINSEAVSAVFGAESQQFIHRYVSSHPVEYVEAAMFFVGMMALLMKVADLIGQYRGLDETLLRESSTPSTADDCPALLDELSANVQNRESYLIRRVRESLQHVRDRGTAEHLDDHLKYMADVDAGRAHDSYALVRIIVWAIPILGFLGTVVGITLAIAQLNPDALESSLEQVTAGLGVAFDTTALALAFSIVLMFTQFLSSQVETRLLENVEGRAATLLSRRFDLAATGGDPQVAAVRRMAEGLLGGMQQLVEQQVQLWRESMDDAQQKWQQAATATQEHAQQILGAGLAHAMAEHARHLQQAADESNAANQQHWEGVRHSLDQAVAAIGAQQKQLVQQGQVLLKVVEATGEVARLEDALNRNLASLAGTHNFEQTVDSLAAVIHLLNARVSTTGAPRQAIPRSDGSVGHAA